MTKNAVKHSLAVRSTLSSRSCRQKRRKSGRPLLLREKRLREILAVLGPKIDGLILVVWGGKTARDPLKQAKEKMDLMKIKYLGVVINSINVQQYDHYRMYNYYSYYEQQKPE